MEPQAQENIASDWLLLTTYVFLSKIICLYHNPQIGGVAVELWGDLVIMKGPSWMELVPL